MNLNPSFQAAAEQREINRLRDDVYTQESILGVPHANTQEWGAGQLRRRLNNLQAQNAQRINPDDNEEQHEPIILGEYLSR